MALVSAQPGTRAGGTTTTSGFTELDMEQNILNTVEHPAPQATRGATSLSVTLQSANTVAICTVFWPHEYVYTPEGQPSEYESMCSLAFVEGYMTIMDMQSDPIRKHNYVGPPKGSHA